MNRDINSIRPSQFPNHIDRHGQGHYPGQPPVVTGGPYPTHFDIEGKPRSGDRACPTRAAESDRNFGQPSMAGCATEAAGEGAPQGPAVQAQINETNEAVMELGSAIAMLEDRLAPILRKTDIAKDGTGLASAHGSSDIARQLQQQTAGVWRMYHLLNDIIERLEV